MPFDSVQIKKSDINGAFEQFHIYTAFGGQIAFLVFEQPGFKLFQHGNLVPDRSFGVICKAMVISVNSFFR